MTRAFTLPASTTLTAPTLVLAATRAWRRARDTGEPTLTALFAALDAHRRGALAPSFASLIELEEAISGRPIRVGGTDSAGPSADELRLLGLLDGSVEIEAVMPEAGANAGLAQALRTAVQSIRILMGAAIDAAGEGAPPPVIEPVGARRGVRLAVYPRKSVAVLVDRLRRAYRVTARILGKSRFHAAALAFARRHPPADPVPHFYGDGFAEFLADQLPIDDIPYLADVATLERLWNEAHLADDAPVLDLGDIGAVDGRAWASRRLPLHPATGFIWLSSPAVTVWQAHQEGRIDPIDPEHRAEGALVTRREDRVALRSISRPEHRMLFGLRLGETVGEAGKATATLYPEADVDTVLADLVGSGAFARPGGMEVGDALGSPRALAT